MKKFLLSIATVLFGATMMSAADVTFNFATETYGLTRETENDAPYIETGTTLTANGGVTVTLNKTEGKNGWRLWSDGLRIYKNSGTSMTLSSSEKITGIEFTMAKASVIEGYSVNGGTAVTVSEKTFTVACDGTSINLGLTCTKNNGAIASMKVILNGEGGGTVTPTPDPDPVETVGKGTQAEPYTVEDVIKLNNNGKTDQWVKGYIVGCFNWDDATKTNNFSATELTTATNIAIASSASGYGTTYIAVQLPAGDIRTALNLVDNAGNLGKEVLVCGGLVKYITDQGVKPCTSYVLDGETPTPPAPVETVGNGTEAKPYTVADVLAMNNTVPGTAWVTGYIVGSATGQSASETFSTGTGENASASNIFIAASASETNYQNCIPVQLPVGDIRTALNLKDNAANLGKKLEIYGSLEKYFGLPGVKTPTAYKLDGQGGETPTPPTPSDTEGDGTEFNPFTVADVIKLNNNGATAQWVSGTIVGVMNYVEGTGNVFSSTELTTNSNLVIAATTADYGTNYVCVQLPAGKIREDLNLVDRPGNVGKEVSVCGDLAKYCGVHGVKNTSAYHITGGLAPLPVGETASLTSFVEDQCTSNTKINGAVTVFYQSPDKKYTFITDGETNLEVYTGAGLANTYVNGDQLTGIVGKYGYYQNMPQMTPQADTFGEPTHGTAVEPVEKALGAIQPADYVTVKGVKIIATTEGEGDKQKTTYTVSDGTNELTLFDRFNIGGIAAGENVTILGIGAVFGETKQLFPIEITAEQDSISEITAGEGQTVIYDLQGRRLNAPVRGINIINGRKVLVK